MPRPLNMAKTWSCSTSCLVNGTVWAEVYASSRILKVILRPFTPPWLVLTYVKYAFSALEIVPYAAAAPDRALVLPRRIELLVTPTSVWVVEVVPPPQAARVSKKTATAANPGAFRPIETPPRINAFEFKQSGCLVVSVQSGDRSPRGVAD